MDRGAKDWALLPEQKLLRMRICDLGLTLRGSFVETHIRQLHAELRERRIPFRPHFWISDEWFTPDGIPGVAVPFYLAHPRLAELELSQMLEVEGGTPDWCMRILRHETGHAFDNAYALRRKKRRQRLFGLSSQPYPEFYTPRAYSKSFVLHLDPWYAQSHPDEDFAETFAVWLSPRNNWEKRYAGWPALKKLQYLDELIRELGAAKPPVRNRRQVDPVHTLRKTLREHYRQKRAFYGRFHPKFYDRDLLRLFSDAPGCQEGPSAAAFLKRIRTEVRRKVASWTGIYQYTIEQVVEEIIARCQELGLHLHRSEEQTKLDFTVLLTVQTMNYLHSGRHQVAL